jgi:hypothetical protein
MGASSRQERAFGLYLALGPERSLSRLAAALRADPGRAGLQRAPSLRTLEDWSARCRWQERIADVDRRTREEAERQHLEWVKQHRERLRQEGLLLQHRGIEWLKGKRTNDVTAHEAIRAIDAGFKLEALALGEATERISMEVDDERIQRLTDEELELLIRHARQAQRGGATGEGETKSG